MRATEKTVDFSTLYIVNNYHMTKINRFITSRISKSMARSRCYRTFPSIYVSSVMHRFILGHWGCCLLYNAIITRKNTAKTNLSARKAAVRHLILSTVAAIITHAKAYDLSTMLIHSVLRHFLLLNQFRAGDIFTSYSYGCWVGL